MLSMHRYPGHSSGFYLEVFQLKLCEHFSSLLPFWYGMPKFHCLKIVAEDYNYEPSHYSVPSSSDPNVTLISLLPTATLA
jgi:hypothetical protein